MCNYFHLMSSHFVLRLLNSNTHVLIYMQCIYLLKDLENNEKFIYFGKDTDYELHKVTLTVAEIDLNENPFGNVS